jgi:predicted flap endonuclease-1-like 5' DNA nuclease
MIARRGFFTRCLMLATLAVALLVPAPAQAGHYRLPIEGLIDESESQALAKAGVTTTLALLQEVASEAKRLKLAQKSGLTIGRVAALAAQVDLLRIDGLGPSMVRLLQGAGIRHSKDLAAAASVALRTKLEAVNGVQHIAGAIPLPEVLDSWIGQAKRLPRAVNDL